MAILCLLRLCCGSLRVWGRVSREAVEKCFTFSYCLLAVQEYELWPLSPPGLHLWTYYCHCFLVLCSPGRKRREGFWKPGTHQ